MNKLTITGVAGEVKWGYRSAATLRSWSVSADATGGTLTASIASKDEYHITQHPLTLVVRMGTWPIDVDTVQIAGDTLSARVGPQKD